MIKHIAIGAAFLAVIAVPAGSWGEENVVTSPQERIENPKVTMPEFPPSPNCTANKPMPERVGRNCANRGILLDQATEWDRAAL